MHKGSSIPENRDTMPTFAGGHLSQWILPSYYVNLKQHLRIIDPTYHGLRRYEPAGSILKGDSLKIDRHSAGKRSRSL